MQAPARLAIACSLVALLLAPPSARAFLTPGKTTGTEIALLPLGPGAWELTIESGDPAANYGGQIGIANAVSFDPNLAICDNDVLALCVPIQGSDVDPLLAGMLFLIVAVEQPGLLDAGIGSPQALGSVRDNGELPRFVDPQYVCDVLMITAAGCDFGFAPPVTVVNPIPEPASGSLLAVVLLLVTARVCDRLRRRAPCKGPDD